MPSLSQDIEKFRTLLQERQQAQTQVRVDSNSASEDDEYNAQLKQEKQQERQQAQARFPNVLKLSSAVYHPPRTNARLKELEKDGSIDDGFYLDVSTSTLSSVLCSIHASISTARRVKQERNTRKPPHAVAHRYLV